MKTTVKLTKTRAITVEPMGVVPGILLEVPCIEGGGTTWTLTPDQAGALIFGLEQALEVIDKRCRATLEGYRAKYEAKQVAA